MSKLDPRPDNSGRKYTWSELNSYLQMIFGRPGDNHSITIQPDKYAMTKEEIIAEAQKQGYTVVETSNGYLTFS